MPTTSSINFSGSYQVYPSYTGTDQVTSLTPFLVPPTFQTPDGSAAAVGKSILIPLQNLLLLNSGPPAYTSNTDFQFQVVGGVAQLIIVGTGNAWSAGATARTNLMTNFTAFLAYMEANYELAGLLVPGSTYIMGQVIADAIPAPLLESSFYRYSLSTGFQPPVNSGAVARAYVDIRPGMRLRVENSASEYVNPGSPLNGYIANGRCEYLVNATATGGGSKVVTFDAFLGTLNAPKITGGPTTPTAVGGGLLDLQAAGTARTYMRLFYPSSMNAAGLAGSLSNTNNPALVGAQTLGMMSAATLKYPTWNQPLTAPATQANTCMIFLGRSAVVPEIQIFATIRGVTIPLWVPVGTTLANVVQRYIYLPPTAQWSALPLNIRRLTSLPTTNSIAVDISTNIPTGAAMPPNMFDLPLVAGDLLTFNF
jgi:hypothetical protein